MLNYGMIFWATKELRKRWNRIIIVFMTIIRQYNGNVDIWTIMYLYQQSIKQFKAGL